MPSFEPYRIEGRPEGQLEYVRGSGVRVPGRKYRGTYRDGQGNEYWRFISKDKLTDEWVVLHYEPGDDD